MDVFHVFKIVQMVPNSAKHHIFKKYFKTYTKFIQVHTLGVYLSIFFKKQQQMTNLAAKIQTKVSSYLQLYSVHIFRHSQDKFIGPQFFIGLTNLNPVEPGQLFRTIFYNLTQ